MTKPNRPDASYSEAQSVRRRVSTGEIELRPDGEERFRKAVHAAAKAGPMHREAKR